MCGNIDTIDELDWLDDYDRIVLQPHFEGVSDESEPMKSMHEGLALLPLWITKQKIVSGETDELSSLLDGELVERTPMFIARSKFYVRLWNYWLEAREGENPAPEIFNRPNRYHFFAPIYVQELEGPFRFQLAAFIDLVTTYLDGNGDWQERLYQPDGDKQGFGHLLDQAIDQADRLHDELGAHYSWALRFLEQDEELVSNSGIDAEYYPRVNEIRNAIAHGDYNLRRREDETIEVVNYLGEEMITTTLGGALSFFFTSTMMMRFLAAGIGLSLYHTSLQTGQIEYSFGITDAYEADIFPPKAENSLLRQYRAEAEEHDFECE